MIYEYVNKFPISMMCLFCRKSPGNPATAKWECSCYLVPLVGKFWIGECTGNQYIEVRLAPFLKLIKHISQIVYPVIRFVNESFHYIAYEN